MSVLHSAESQQPVFMVTALTGNFEARYP